MLDQIRFLLYIYIYVYVCIYIYIYYILYLYIGFFLQIRLWGFQKLKGSKHRLKKEMFIFVKNIVLTIGFLLVNSENFLNTKQKIMLWLFTFATKNQS